MSLKAQISEASVRNIGRQIWKPGGYQKKTVLHLVEMKAA